MSKIIRAIMILAVAGGLGVLATGTAFASAASSQFPYHGQPASGDAYQQPQGRVSLPDGGSNEPPQVVARPDNTSVQPPQVMVARPDGGTDEPPQVVARLDNSTTQPPQLVARTDGGGDEPPQDGAAI